MSPAHVLAPTYDAIKQRLIEGFWKQGYRLEANRIAEDLGVSMTPVRDSLYRLTGERMVDFVHSEGFRVPVLSESMLRDLFGLNAMLLDAALAQLKAGAPIPIKEANDIVTRTCAIFASIARRTSNMLVAHQIASLNDKLLLVRKSEANIFPDALDEIAELEAASKRHDAGQALLRDLVRRYHERRISKVANLIHCLTTAETDD